MIRALVLAAALALTGSPVAAAETCTVDDATLTWGFKESFRSYISGTIANGEWTVADGATYETPSFGWSGGTGDLEAGRGTISFTGSVTFTGHGGVLNTTVANPQLRFDGTGVAALLLDVSGTTQEGEPVDEHAVEFATIQLNIPEQADGALLTGSPAALTEAGAAAFGTYEAGEQLDAIFAMVPASRGCLPMLYPADTEGTGMAQALAVIGGILGVLLVVVLLVVARRRTRDATKRYRPGA